jgi:hypothetical protein
MTELNQQTEKISDPAVRARVLEGIPLHQEIVAAWTALQSESH